MLTTEGCQHLLEIMGQDQSPGYYMGLAEDDYAAVSIGATLADLTELSGGGYARQAVGGWHTWTGEAAADNGWKITTNTITFTANGFTWPLAQTLFLATTASGTAGKLVAIAPVLGGAGVMISDGADFEMTMVFELTPDDITTEGCEHLLGLLAQDEVNAYTIGLAEDDYASLDASTTLADLTELSGGGYGRQGLGGTGTWTSAAGTNNGWKITTDEVTFTATGDWALAKTAFLARGTKLVAVGPVNGGTGIALATGQSYDYSFTLSLTPLAEV